MRPAARLQSAIELLDAIIIAARDGGSSADQLAKRFFAERRYAGSKDRRAVREFAWSAIRRFGERPETARSAFVAMADNDADLADLFDGSDYGPATIDDNEPRASGDVLPEWLLPYLSPLVDGAERKALLDRAPLDLRANALKVDRNAVLPELAEAETLAHSPYALRLPTGSSIEDHPAHLDGRIEIQDLGSQLIVDACKAEPGMTVLDLCAGAGGKTLALAAAMGGDGRLIATDTNRARLDQLKPRANRAGAGYIETRLLDPGRELAKLDDLKGQCDVVLIDAPCSGSGTWRRNPETRWRLTPVRLKRVIDEQAKLLSIGAELVTSGGHLIFAICSLLESEGRGQVAEFLKARQGFMPVPTDVHAGRTEGDGTLLTPLHDGSDGFFFARLQKL